MPGNQFPFWSWYHTEGELVTAEKIRGMQTYILDTMLTMIGRLNRGYSEVQRSGVAEGLAPSANPGNQLVNINPGIAFRYNVVKDVLSVNPIDPIANLLIAPVAIANPNAANPRYDLIVAQPNPALTNYAQRMLRLPSGVKQPQNLPGHMGMGVTFVVYTGFPQAIPVVPAGALGDVPLAVVLVPAGAGPAVIPAGDIFDVRVHLNPRTGGISAYQGFFITNAANPLATIVEAVTDPSIQIDTPIARFGAGVYRVILNVPETAFGTHPTAPFESSHPLIVQGGGTLGGGISGLYVQGAIISISATIAGGALRQLTIDLQHAQETGGANTQFTVQDSTDRFSARIEFIRTD